MCQYFCLSCKIWQRNGSVGVVLEMVRSKEPRQIFVRHCNQPIRSRGNRKLPWARSLIPHEGEVNRGNRLILSIHSTLPSCKDHFHSREAVKRSWLLQLIDRRKERSPPHPTSHRFRSTAAYNHVNAPGKFQEKIQWLFLSQQSSWKILLAVETC